MTTELNRWGRGQFIEALEPTVRRASCSVLAAWARSSFGVRASLHSTMIAVLEAVSRYRPETFIRAHSGRVGCESGAWEFRGGEEVRVEGERRIERSLRDDGVPAPGRARC